MPLAQEEFADQTDNELFVAIKLLKWPNVKTLIEEKPYLVCELDTYGNSVLHAAIGYKAPDDILLRFLQIFPAAATVHGTEDWTPLHVAAMWGCSTPVMDALIRANPAALDDVGQGGIKGRTPRHFSDRFPHNKELLNRTTEDWIALIAAEEEKNTKAIES
jgi:hypothetical protein